MKMLILIVFAYLVTNFSIIKCNDPVHVINVQLDKSDTCLVKPINKFPIGADIDVLLNNKSGRTISLAVAKKDLGDQSDVKAFLINIYNVTGLAHIPTDNKNYTLFFKFIYTPNEGNIHPMCETKVYFERSTNETELFPDFINDKWLGTSIVIGGVAAAIAIIALSATTVYYKRQVNMLRKHNILITRTEGIDTNDYTPYPGKGKTVVPIVNNNRDSDIYEDPNIALGVPSIPPALPTSPRPKRGDCSMTRTLSSASSMTLKSNISAPPTLPRSKPSDKEAQFKISMAQRPPLPLPTDEVYSEAQEEETYEEPPAPDPPMTRTYPWQRDRLGKMPEKIVKPRPENIVRPLPENTTRPRAETIAKSLEEKLGQKFPKAPGAALKLPGLKPPVPSGKPTPPRNKDSNPKPKSNVVQIPIRQIPESSTKKKAPIEIPKPNEKPKSPTLQQHIQFFNDNRGDSSDDENWDYEPLPQINIYNN